MKLQSPSLKVRPALLPQQKKLLFKSCGFPVNVMFSVKSHDKMSDVYVWKPKRMLTPLKLEGTTLNAQAVLFIQTHTLTTKHDLRTSLGGST